MNKIDIWMQGYSATGNSQGAAIIATYVVYDFHKAVELYMIAHPGDVYVSKVDGTKSYSVWGCKLFDNEEDAKKAFG